MAVTTEMQRAGRVLTLKLTGKLVKADYEHFVPLVESMVKEHGKVRMIVDMHDFHGWEMAALWEDIKFDAKHFNDIERLALIGEKKWEHGMAVFCRPFTTAKIQYFTREHAADAEAWIAEGL